MKAALLAVALLLMTACSPLRGSSSAANSGNGCAHPGICLTLTGPLAGTTSGLVQVPDCIPGGGVDAVFITHVGSHETSIEILATDSSTRTGFHPGSFTVRQSRGAPVSGAFASIFIKPDSDIAGFRGGWTSDAPGSSGTVTIDGNLSGKVQDTVIAPASGSGASLHVAGGFNCQ